MSDKQTIIILGAPALNLQDLYTQIRSEYGQDAVILTEAEAKEKGIAFNAEKTFTVSSYRQMPLPNIEPYVDDILANHKAECRKGWRQPKRFKKK